MTDTQPTVADGLLEIDRAAHETVSPYRDTAPVRVLAWLSELGDQPQMLTLSTGVLAVGLARGDARLIRAGGRMIAAHLLATGAKNVIKRRIDRTRPAHASAGRKQELKQSRSGAKEESSFPSGHSAGALAVALAAGRELPEYRAAAMAGAGFIALAQIPRCAHYPTDVGAGLAIGWAAELTVDRALRLAWRFAAA